MLELHHFYHAYAGGNWHASLTRHFDAVEKSGLLENLDSIHIGIVGPKRQREAVKDALDARQISYFVCAEADSGWEQETLAQLLEFSQVCDGLVLYGHTKGAAFPTRISTLWHRAMIGFTINRWKECVTELLNGASAAGLHYDVAPTAKHSFAGNYYWTHLEYIRYFPPVLRNTRYDAELWTMNLEPAVLACGDEFSVFDQDKRHPGVAYERKNRR